MPGNDVEAYCLLCECKYEERSTTTIKVIAGLLPVPGSFSLPCHAIPGTARLVSSWRRAQKGKIKLSQLVHGGSARGTVSESGGLLAVRSRLHGSPVFLLRMCDSAKHL